MAWTRTYSEWKEPKKLSVEELDELWLATAKELYGEEGEVFTYENTNHLWAYVSHFHRPFYVYGYAFGELLTQSLYAQQSRLGSRFEPLYLDLLRSGATKDVVEFLQPFGLNPAEETFWARRHPCEPGDNDCGSRELGSNFSIIDSWVVTQEWTSGM